MIQNDKTMTLDIPDARWRNKKQADIDMLCCIVLLFVIQIPKAWVNTIGEAWTMFYRTYFIIDNLPWA